MIEKMDRIVEVLFTIMKYVLTAILAVMVFILCWHIFARYVLNDSLSWSEELLKILLVWFSMLSVAILVARREHVSIVIFKEHMPEKLASFFTKFTQVLTFAVCVAVVFIGIRYMQTAGFRPTPALRIPYGFAYAAIPVSFALVSLFEFRNMLVDLTGKGKHQAIEKPEEDLTGGEEITL